MSKVKDVLFRQEEKEFNEILSLSNKYKQIYNSVGIHPHETENLNKNIFIKFLEIIKIIIKSFRVF